MIPSEEIRPLKVDDVVGEVIMRFFQSDGIPVVDERGSCVGVVYAADCKEVSRSPFSSLLSYLIILLHLAISISFLLSSDEDSLYWQHR